MTTIGLDSQTLNLMASIHFAMISFSKASILNSLYARTWVMTKGLGVNDQSERHCIPSGTRLGMGSALTYFCGNIVGALESENEDSAASACPRV